MKFFLNNCNLLLFPQLNFSISTPTITTFSVDSDSHDHEDVFAHRLDRRDANEPGVQGEGWSDQLVFSSELPFHPGGTISHIHVCASHSTPIN